MFVLTFHHIIWVYMHTCVCTREHTQTHKPTSITHNLCVFPFFCVLSKCRNSTDVRPLDPAFLRPGWFPVPSNADIDCRRLLPSHLLSPSSLVTVVSFVLIFMLWEQFILGLGLETAALLTTYSPLCPMCGSCVISIPPEHTCAHAVPNTFHRPLQTALPWTCVGYLNNFLCPPPPVWAWPMKSPKDIEGREDSEFKLLAAQFPFFQSS